MTRLRVADFEEDDAIAETRAVTPQDYTAQTPAPPLWYLALHLLESNLVTPVLLGRRLTINPVAIFISLMFWLWLWGVPGALMAVPILVSVKIVCDHIPSASFVSELIGR